MKLLVVTYGTEGDTRPFSALCRGLIDAGHEASLLADAATLGSARALKVPAAALAGDIRSTLGREVAAIASHSRNGGLAQTARALGRIANDHAEDWLRTVIAHAQGCDVLLASGLAAFAAFSAGEYLQVRVIGSGTIPITPTSAFPSPFLSQLPVPRFLNRMSHRFVNALLWRTFRSRTNAARRLFGLAPRGAVWQGVAAIYGASRHLVPVPADWPPGVQLCGQFLAPVPGWTPPQELKDFLAAGEAPVYVGFGSMTGFEPRQLLEAVVRALAGRRALFHLGWSGIEPAALPASIMPIGDTPHDWLFPRMAAVIHHGGSGTTHSAARAGVPSIVTPFAADQFFWAQRLRLAGVAPEPVDAHRPTVDAYARALEFAGTARAQQQARALGEAMRAENGVSCAVKTLEATMAATREQ